MPKTVNLQDAFLAKARRTKSIVTVILVNGYQLRGIVAGYDSFVVIIMTDAKQQCIYKHAISTIIPELAFDLSAEEEA